MSIKTIFASTFLAVALSSSLSLMPQKAAANVVIIYHDGGGVLSERLETFDTYQRAGTRVEIRGTCKSACTVFLGLRNVCVAPDALLSFHGPMYQNGSAMTRARFDHWTGILSSYYPKGIDRWFMKTARHVVGGNNFLTIKGSELFKYGVRECDGVRMARRP